MASISVKRKKQFKDLFCAWDIIINCKPVEKIRGGQSKALEIEPGEYTIGIRYNVGSAIAELMYDNLNKGEYIESNTINIKIADNDKINFICGHAGPYPFETKIKFGFPFRAIEGIYYKEKAKNYLWLKLV